REAHFPGGWPLERAGPRYPDPGVTPQELCAAALERAGRVLVEADEPFRLLLAAFLVDGPVLIASVPGTAKTLIARTVAQLVAGQPEPGAEPGPGPGPGRDERRFQRIQFPPDLMPSDILGTMVFNSATSTFAFRPGPIFASV